MSRHALAPRPDRPDVARAVIGWDRPLRTFFVQAFGLEDEAGDDEEPILLWEGTAPGELATVEVAIARIAPFALISNGLAGQLEAERRDGHDRRDGPTQQSARRFIAGIAKRMPD